MMFCPLTMLVQRTVETIRRAQKSLVLLTAIFGLAKDDTLLLDSRQPHVPDGILRAIPFKRADNGKRHVVIIDWSCHPESMGSRYRQLTTDFPDATVALLKQHSQCPVVYFTSSELDFRNRETFVFSRTAELFDHGASACIAPDVDTRARHVQHSVNCQDHALHFDRQSDGLQDDDHHHQAGVWNPHEPYRPDTSLSTLLAMILRDLENVPRMKERK